MLTHALAKLPRRDLLCFGLLAVVGVALLAVLAVRLLTAFQAASAASAAGASHMAGRVHPAPDFTLTTWAWAGAPSQTVHLAALKGHPVVLNFWASWCNPCHQEAPTLEAAWRQYQAKGVIFIGVDVNDTQTDALAFLRQYGITYLNGPDATGHITLVYGAPGLPVTVFIDRHGNLVSKHIGLIDASTLDRNIRSLLDS